MQQNKKHEKLLFRSFPAKTQDKFLRQFLSVFQVCLSLHKTLVKKQAITEKKHPHGCWISDHYKMIMTIFRFTFTKGKPKTFYYRCFKNFNLEQFEMELKEKIDDISNNSFDIFLEKIKTCLDKFAPLKEKKIRFNKSIFMSKSLR